jgi:hypothetical protein
MSGFWMGWTFFESTLWTALLALSALAFAMVFKVRGAPKRARTQPLSVVRRPAFERGESGLCSRAAQRPHAVAGALLTPLTLDLAMVGRVTDSNYTPHVNASLLIRHRSSPVLPTLAVSVLSTPFAGKVEAGLGVGGPRY